MRSAVLCWLANTRKKKESHEFFHLRKMKIQCAGTIEQTHGVPLEVQEEE